MLTVFARAARQVVVGAVKDVRLTTLSTLAEYPGFNLDDFPQDAGLIVKCF
jgi:hypothetical protein